MSALVTRTPHPAWEAMVEALHQCQDIPAWIFQDTVLLEGDHPAHWAAWHAAAAFVRRIVDALEEER